MHIGENIRRLRVARGESQQDLAQVCGVTDKAVSTWECGRKTPRMAVLMKVARHYGIKPSELIDGEIPLPPMAITHGIAMYQGRARMDENEHEYEHASDRLAEPRAPLPYYDADEPDPDPGLFKNPRHRASEDLSLLIEAFRAAKPETQRSVRKLLNLDAARSLRPRKVEMIVYDDPAAAGLPLYAESDFERLCFPASAVPQGADFGIRILGESMAPTISDGDIVWVRKQDELRDGEIGIFMLADSAVCKRLCYPSGAHAPRLLSDNPAYPPIEGAQLMDLRVVGRVLKAAP